MKKITLYGDTISLTYLPEQATTISMHNDVIALLKFIETVVPAAMSVEVINYIVETYSKVDFGTTESNDIFLDE